MVYLPEFLAQGGGGRGEGRGRGKRGHGGDRSVSFLP